LLLVLCRCASFGSTTNGADEGFSGSSTPRATRESGTIVGGVFIGVGGGGEAEAEDLARRNCERYQLKAEIDHVVTAEGSVRLRYTCQ
jgi:hypothetical protein